MALVSCGVGECEWVGSYIVHSGAYGGGVIRRRDRGFSLVLRRVYRVNLVRRESELKVVCLHRVSRGAILRCSLATVGYRLCCVRLTRFRYGGPLRGSYAARFHMWCL